MRDKTDIYNVHTKYETKVDRVKQSGDISDSDKGLLLRFKDNCVAEGLTEGRILKYLTHLEKINRVA
jgi:hypothetical protein